MTTATLGAIGDSVVLVGLWVGVVLRRIPPPARLALALLSFAGAWALCFLMMRLHFPRWTVLPGTGALLISLVLVVVAAQLSLPHDGGGSGGEDGGGGLEKPPPDRPTGGGDSSEPDWWPEFEREFARYQAERDTTQPLAPAGRESGGGDPRPDGVCPETICVCATSPCGNIFICDSGFWCVSQSRSQGPCRRGAVAARA